MHRLAIVEEYIPSTGYVLYELVVLGRVAQGKIEHPESLGRDYLAFRLLGLTKALDAACGARQVLLGFQAKQPITLLPWV